MSNPQDVATIIVNGKVYGNWKTIEVSRDCGSIVSYMKFSGAEPTPTNNNLFLGDQAVGMLGGSKAITGPITMRQVAYDARNHGAQFIVTSRTQDAMVASPPLNPGQFINQTFQQMCSAVCSSINLPVQVLSAPGTDLPFPRVSVQVGETIAAFMQRLAKYRNVHSVDDANGNLIWFRTNTGNSGTLVEGGNILSARLILQADESMSSVGVRGQNVGGSVSETAGTPAAEVYAQSQNNIYPGGGMGQRLQLHMADMPTDQPSAQMLADHVISLENIQQVDLRIVVKGWFASSGACWLECLRSHCVINSPMLVWQGPFSLTLWGVRCMQDDHDGTTTELTLTNQLGEGQRGGVAQVGSPTGGNP